MIMMMMMMMVLMILMLSLQTHNVQLKGEVARYKRKFREKEMAATKLRKELDDMKTAEIKALQAKKEVGLVSGSGGAEGSQEGGEGEVKKEEAEGEVKGEGSEGREGAAVAAAGHGDAQEEGHRVGAVRG